MDIFEHVMFVQKVKKEKKQEYINTHVQVWPEVLIAIKESGFEREIVWLFGDYLCIYMMSKNFDNAWKSLTEKEIFKKWTKEILDPIFTEMQDFSREGRIIRLEKVFDMEEQFNKL